MKSLLRLVQFRAVVTSICVHMSQVFWSLWFIDKLTKSILRCKRICTAKYMKLTIHIRTRLWKTFYTTVFAFCKTQYWYWGVHACATEFVLGRSFLTRGCTSDRGIREGRNNRTEHRAVADERERICVFRLIDCLLSIHRAFLNKPYERGNVWSL